MLAALFVLCVSGVARAQDALVRGEYLFNVGGCLGCHTDVKNGGPPLAGGRELKTPFGTFYGPNITPDPTHGIGRWSEADFIRAMRQGIRPDGSHYFPVFPFTSFTKIVDADLRDLFAYLRAQPPVARPNKPHDVGFPFNLRFLQIGWKWLNFTPGPMRPDLARNAAVNRGAYIVEALAHCGECHTGRDWTGGTIASMRLAGTRDAPEGGSIPNITPDPRTGLGKWSPADLKDLLKLGLTLEGDFVGSSMAEVVRNSTSKLTDADIEAVIAYLRALPAVDHDVRSKR